MQGPQHLDWPPAVSLLESRAGFQDYNLLLGGQEEQQEFEKQQEQHEQQKQEEKE